MGLVKRLLKELGYSYQANQQLATVNYSCRDEQFQIICFWVW